MRSPVIRLAAGGNSHKHLQPEFLATFPPAKRPALLVSYVFLKQFMKHRDKFCVRDWTMDSGAFSAHYSGVTIHLQQYIETCLELMANDPTLAEIFALDVIGDHKASLRNAEKMWEAGVPAIPCYHSGEPWDALMHIAKTYPKIALGGVAGCRIGPVKKAWAGQCFARIWPARVHGFGFGAKTHMLALPWDSVDSTNWELDPQKYGRWQSLGTPSFLKRTSRFWYTLSIRGKLDLRAEVKFCLDVEAEARRRWANEMAMLDKERPYSFLPLREAALRKESP